MDLLTRFFGRTALLGNLALGVGLAGLLGIEFRLSTPGTWSAGQPVTVAVGVAVGLGVLALFRERNRRWALAGGLLICAVAAVWSGTAELPSQPGFTATAALLVLGASYVRVGTSIGVGLVAVAGLVVLTAGRVGLRPSLILPVALLGVIVWGAALGTGIWLRSLDLRNRAAMAAARREERLELARELHDVVAHHVAAIVVRSQAARLTAAKRPHELPDALADIESAGGDALIAMRQVVGLLRRSDDDRARA